MAFIKKKELRAMEKKQEKMEKELEKAKRKNSGGGIFNTGYVIAAECMFLLMGALLLFVPQIQIIHICYGLSGVLVFVGIIQIVHYFLAESYRNMNEYGFSIGVLGVILGMCALVRVQAIANSFLLVLGIFLLLTAIIKLQYAMDLKSMKDPVWVVAIILAALLIAGAVCVIINPFHDPELHKLVTYYLLLVDGVVGIISNIYLFIRVKLYARKERKQKEQGEGAAQTREDAAPGILPQAEVPEQREMVPADEPTVCREEKASDAANDVEEWISSIPEAEHTEEE